MPKKTWYSISNKSNTIDIMVYGAIVSGSWKWSDDDVVAQDFIKAFADSKSGDVANIYVNSPGGSVFTTAGIIAIIERAKEKGVVVNAYIDGLAASAASFLVMAADNIFIYDTSTIMVHRAMISAYGNADELQAAIDLVVMLEESTIIPMYLQKAKDGLTEDDLKAMMKAETWLDSSAFAEKFKVTRIENTKKVAAFVDVEILSEYKNVPDGICGKVEPEIVPPEVFDEKPKGEVTNVSKELAMLDLALAM